MRKSRRLRLARKRHKIKRQRQLDPSAKPGSLLKERPALQAHAANPFKFKHNKGLFQYFHLAKSTAEPLK
jgi:hypothetical protein